MQYFYLLAGLYILNKGADFLIDGSTSLAKIFKVSSLVIGLTIVALGTTLPEFFVNVSSVAKGETEIAFGNIIGSNIANILLILGLLAIIYPLTIPRSIVWKEIPFSLGAAIILLVLANDLVIDDISTSILSRNDGLILIFFFLLFLYFLYDTVIRKKVHLEAQRITLKVFSSRKTITLIIVGIAALYLGGEWTVRGAIDIARQFGLSEFLISASVISIGTSLPELITSIKAAIQQKADLAIGNIIGANVFNIFWVLGLTSMIAPIKLPAGINFDIIFLILATCLLLAFLFFGKRHKFGKWQGLTLIGCYLCYIIFIVWRG